MIGIADPIHKAECLHRKDTIHCMVLDHHTFTRDSNCFSHENTLVVRMVENINEKHAIKALVWERKLRAIDFFNWYIGSRTEKNVNSLNADIRPVSKNDVVYQTIATTYVEHAAPRKDSCKLPSQNSCSPG
jgi:hypothetical protein